MKNTKLKFLLDIKRKKNKMAKKKITKGLTHINFVLDETGSMSNIEHEVMTGFNKYIDDLKADGDELYRFSLLKFDSTKLEQVYDDVLPSIVNHLDNKSYRPGAMTPLYDAISHSLRNIEDKVKSGDKVLTVIFTDGQENSSKEMTLDKLKTMMKDKETLGWAFMYLGVAVDAWSQVNNFIGTTTASNFLNTSGAAGVSAAYSTATIARQRYSGGNTTLDSLVTDEDRKNAAGK